jgi:2-oxoglutarate ferredoxin oxidoreductase subunit alpha
VKPRDAERSKNLFALGLISWMYTRPEQVTIDWINEKFGSKPAVRDANLAAFRAGHAFGETAELFDHPYTVQPYEKPAGVYTSISGNTATAWGLVAASQLAKLPLFLGSYPITPASDILHELSKHKNFGVRTMQAEDEIAGIGAALGAAYGGHLAVTTTSGPGVALKSETIGLAISLELPLIIIDVQRGGPSTGLPTKTEQSDLMLAMYGHHGDSPLPIVSASTPAGCFFAAIEAARIALKYRTPVFLLTDGYLANGAEPWRIPDVSTLPDISVSFTTETNHVDADGPASSTASAASRRRTERATSPTSPRTTSGWCTCGPTRSPASPTTSPPPRSWATSTTPRSWLSAGAPPGAPSTVPWSGCKPTAARSPTCT